MQDDRVVILLGLAFFTVIAFMVLQSRNQMCPVYPQQMYPVTAEYDRMGRLTVLKANSQHA